MKLAGLHSRIRIDTQRCVVLPSDIQSPGHAHDARRDENRAANRRQEAGKEQNADDRRTGRRHQHSGSRDILGPPDHRVVLGPGVIDQHFQRGVKELGRDHHRETDDKADELDDGKSQHQRRDQDDRGGHEVNTQIRLRRERPPKSPTGVAETVERSAQVDAVGAAGADDPLGFELCVGTRRHGWDPRIRVVSAVMASSSAGSAWS